MSAGRAGERLPWGKRFPYGGEWGQAGGAHLWEKRFAHVGKRG